MKKHGILWTIDQIIYVAIILVAMLAVIVIVSNIIDLILLYRS